MKKVVLALLATSILLISLIGARADDSTLIFQNTTPFPTLLLKLRAQASFSELEKQNILQTLSELKAALLRERTSLEASLSESFDPDKRDKLETYLNHAFEISLVHLAALERFESQDRSINLSEWTDQIGLRLPQQAETSLHLDQSNHRSFTLKPIVGGYFITLSQDLLEGAQIELLSDQPNERNLFRAIQALALKQSKERLKLYQPLGYAVPSSTAWPTPTQETQIHRLQDALYRSAQTTLLPLLKTNYEFPTRAIIQLFSTTPHWDAAREALLVSHLNFSSKSSEQTILNRLSEAFTLMTPKEMTIDSAHLQDTLKQALTQWLELKIRTLVKIGLLELPKQDLSLQLESINLMTSAELPKWISAWKQSARQLLEEHSSEGQRRILFLRTVRDAKAFYTKNLQKNISAPTEITNYINLVQILYQKSISLSLRTQQTLQDLLSHATTLLDFKIVYSDYFCTHLGHDLCESLNLDHANEWEVFFQTLKNELPKREIVATQFSESIRNNPNLFSIAEQKRRQTLRELLLLGEKMGLQHPLQPLDVENSHSLEQLLQLLPAQDLIQAKKIYARMQKQSSLEANPLLSTVVLSFPNRPLHARENPRLVPLYRLIHETISSNENLSQDNSSQTNEYLCDVLAPQLQQALDLSYQDAILTVKQVRAAKKLSDVKELLQSATFMSALLKDRSEFKFQVEESYLKLSTPSLFTILSDRLVTPYLAGGFIGLGFLHFGSRFLKSASPLFNAGLTVVEPFLQGYLKSAAIASFFDTAIRYQSTYTHYQMTKREKQWFYGQLGSTPSPIRYFDLEKDQVNTTLSFWMTTATFSLDALFFYHPLLKEWWTAKYHLNTQVKTLSPQKKGRSWL